MKLEGEQVLLRFLVETEKKFDFLFPLYKHLVSLGIKSGLAGLTVIKGLKGFIGVKYINDLNVLEIVDKPERVNLYLEKCSKYLNEVIVSIERAHVFIYRTKDDERGNIKKLSIIETVERSKKREVAMGITSEKVLVRIFIGDSDRDKISNKHLYEVIFEEAKKLGFMAGIVYKGIMGFGKAGRVNAIETIELSVDLPVIIEIMGDEEKLDTFLEFCDGHVVDGLITLERVMVYNK